MTYFIIAYHISIVNIQTNYCSNNLLILDLKQLIKIMKLYYFYTLKAPWDGQVKIKMYYGMSRVKMQLSGKRSINTIKVYTTKKRSIQYNVFRENKPPAPTRIKDNIWSIFQLSCCYAREYAKTNLF